jgi:hypothetical protein
VKAIYLSILLALTILSGCAANTGFVKTGDNSYMYAKESDWVTSGGSVKADMYKEAADFCAKQDKQFEQTSSTSSDSNGITSRASAEIQFRCVDK